LIDIDWHCLLRSVAPRLSFLQVFDKAGDAQERRTDRQRAVWQRRLISAT